MTWTLYGSPLQTYYVRSGANYTASSSGQITRVTDQDKLDLVAQGLVVQTFVEEAIGGGPPEVTEPNNFALDPAASGTSHTVTLSAAQTITYWSSTMSGIKSVSLPGATFGNSGYFWINKATLGDGTVYIISPTSGTIEGASSYSYTDNNKDSVSFVSDGNSNWMLV